MIEVILELKLDSFVVNGMSDSKILVGPLPPRALRFTCVKITSALQLSGETPSANFDFLDSSIQHKAGLESDREFDEQLLKYLATHATVDTSRVVVALKSSENLTKSKASGHDEIGRLSLVEQSNQSSVNLEMFIRRDEFDAAWELLTKQKIMKIVAVLVCFYLGQDKPEPMLVAGVLSSSLQLIPNLQE